MQGVVFTELSEFVEEALGFDVLDKVLEKSGLDNGGVFTQGGNYPFSDLLKLVTALSEVSNKPIPELLEIFGKHLFKKLVLLYGKNIEVYDNVLDFIDTIEDVVHIEVKKLYPNADLPTFTTISKSEDELVLVYQSEKSLEDFAKGLMLGCSEYFNQKLDVNYEILSQNPHKVKFIIKKV